jgi:hypothetical protein
MLSTLMGAQRLRTIRRSFVVAGLALVLPSCGGSGSPGGASASVTDAGSDARADADANGSPSSTYPAFAADVPQVRANQGTVLKTPILVTITWPAVDPNVSTWEAFGDGIGSSTFWNDTTSEYGIGVATSGAPNHVRMSDSLPPSMTYYEVQDYVIAALGGTLPDGGASEGGIGSVDGGEAGANSSLWPAPTSEDGNIQTIYSLFIPASTAVTDPGSGQSFCDEGGSGYHDSVVVGGRPVAYSVTLECPSQPVASSEETASHEYVEATTNPYPTSASLGYVGFDADHLSWDLYTGYNDELADACQNWADSYIEEAAPFPYWVQRIWSNARALAGHDPCAPEPAGPYRGITLFPSEEASISVDLTSIGMSKTTTRGFAAKVGQTVTFGVGFYSDAATNGSWAIAYDFPQSLLLFDAMGQPVRNGAATVQIDQTVGQNGEIARVSVTPTVAGELGFQVMAITWNPPPALVAATYQPHYAPLVVSNE